MVSQHTQDVNLWTVWQPCFPKCHLTGQPSFLTWLFFLVGAGLTWKPKCACTHIRHLRSWNNTSEMKSQWLIKVCSEQLWLISNHNYRNVLHSWETTFLGQHGVDVCIFTETHLRSGETFQMANYVCHHTASLTEGGGTATLVWWDIDHYAVPIQGVRYLVGSALQLTIITIIIVIIYCSWFVTLWQWLFYMYTKHEIGYY